ncbi:hypothetical protein [Nocardioides pantholopis]|uniref:hypothetical protein n=1 Tax=Nocardioides pantholopis TaxID=2483798 RepID=UPI000FD71963|nr:hypothetical protein [Nocardioides pantholopis]
MSRPADWSPLAGADPVPGEPEEVRRLGRKLRQVADAITEQAAKLRTLCSDEYWDSDAGRRFESTARDTATKLEKAFDRYDAAAKAVETYVPVLEEEQRISLELRTQAQELQASRDQAQSRMDADPTDPEVPERPGRGMDQATVEGFGSDLGRLQKEVQFCADRVADAGRQAARGLTMVIDDDGLKDGRFEGLKKWAQDRIQDVKDWIHEHADLLKLIADVAGWIATACGIAALLVGWIPVIGQALAAVLTVVALAATAVSLVCHLALYWTGDGGLLDIALDVVGLATFGVGRAAISGVRGAVSAVNASGKMSAAAIRASTAITARGGRATDAVIDALSSGDLGRAASLSGVRANSLKGMMGSQFGDLTATFGPGGFKHLTQTMASAPGLVPRGADLLSGFRPSAWSSMGPEAMDGLRTIGQNWHNTPALIGEGVQNLRVSGLQNIALDADTITNISSVVRATDGFSTSALNSSLHSLNVQMGQAAAATAVGTGVDAADKAGLFDGAKTWGWRSPL